MIEKIKSEIKEALESFYKTKYNMDINVIVEEPKKRELGDISIPSFQMIKALKKPMPEVIEEITQEVLKVNDIKSVSAMGPFVNVLVDKEKLAVEAILNIISSDSLYGSSNDGKDKTIVIDYSSPNIAKSFSVGHLRSTMIGNSLKLIYKKCGYNVVGINYLGDWGTQFGKMIVAYKKWGNKEEILKDPINKLSELYVLFHQKVKDDPSLEDEAREAFRQMELGNKEYLDLWSWIREESLKESEQIYDLLGISFDSYNGEAYYNDKMEPVVEELKEKNLLVKDQGALIVNMGDNMPPALIKRSDGGSLYITRDLAAVLDRKNKYNFDKVLYVVGNEQKLHFEQLKALISKMNYDFADDIVHVNFGLYLKDGHKMSTRSGGVVKLYDLLMKAISMAYDAINTKNPELDNKEEIAKNVGIAAIVFGDLKNHRGLDIEFNLDEAIQFEGQTGPYLQYTGVRIASILNKESYGEEIDASLFTKPHYFELAKLLMGFNQAITKAASEYAPSVIAKYLLTLAQSFNKFYALEKINCSDIVVKNTNLMLIKAIRIVLNEGLRLLGINYLEKM